MKADPGYQQRMADALIQAMLTTAKDKASNTAVLRTDEIVSALTDLAAMVIATSDVVGTPAKKREFCTDLAKRLQRRINGFQEHYAAGRSPFDTVLRPGEMH